MTLKNLFEKVELINYYLFFIFHILSSTQSWSCQQGEKEIKLTINQQWVWAHTHRVKTISTTTGTEFNLNQENPQQISMKRNQS